MSRNIADTHCQQCGSSLFISDESPRKLTKEEAGPYYDEFEGLMVFNATCVVCTTHYLAWHKPPEEKNKPWRMAETPSETVDEISFFDLSYRSTFNDEPGEKDIPDDLPDTEYNTEVELLPCPFCKSEDLVPVTDNRFGRIEKSSLQEADRIMCNDCGAIGPLDGGKSVQKAWNCRALRSKTVDI